MKNPNTLKWGDLKTGIFFVIGLGLAAYLGLVVGKNSSLFKSAITIQMMAQNVGSLKENNFVSVSGKKIGTVSKMEFINRNDSLFILVQMRLEEEFAPIITNDSKARIISLGILGDKYVDITTGSGKPVEEGDFITLDESETGLDNLTKTAGEAVGQINTLLDKINNGKGPLAKLLGSEEMAGDLEKTLNNLQTASAELTSFSRELKSGKGLLPKLINDKQLASETRETIVNIKQAAARTDSLVQKLNSNEGTIGQLHSNPALYSNINKSVESLDSLIVDLKENPKRYVRFSLF
ncbi:MAG: MCE family protein [Chlorobium phaeobacteroides]|uniref:Mammalian cell entry related domain protein n=1 Tax=Chlorobium phaeobacteroides (strain BS1) TaxID=331678 RepID=B3ELU9_CHLPB|nr:MCE family protein [Chlorobium phaeobacteroides]NEX14687.1 MCE family protein [Prosthecochloris sp.]